MTEQHAGRERALRLLDGGFAGEARSGGADDALTAVDNSVTSASECLSRAWLAIAQASATESPRERYDLSSLAALRAAAAVVAAFRGTDHAGVDAGGVSVWTLVPRWAPELREWADFFAAVTEVRVRMHRRGPVGITQRLADDMLRDADRFVHEVRSVLLRRRTRGAASGPGRDARRHEG